MAPKPKPKYNPKTAGTKTNAFNALDEFMESGSTEAGTQSSAVTVGVTVQEKQRQTLREKYDEGKAMEAMALNMMKL